MQFLTDRKRASGLGAAKTGTHHHWVMMVSSFALIILIPAFVFSFGCILGSSYEDVLAYYQRPLPATIALLTIAVSLFHFRMGVQTMIEDYVQGLGCKLLIIAMICISYGAAALGVLSILRLAF